jgi:hypothetical protein
VLGHKRESEKGDSAGGATVEEAQIVESNSHDIGAPGEQSEDDEEKSKNLVKHCRGHRFC